MITVEELLTDRDLTESLTVRRTSGSFDSFGRWQESTVSEFDVIGSWQRVTERELVQLGIGDIQGETRKLLTKEEIICNTADTNSSDRILWAKNSGRYRVVKVTDDSNFGFYRAFAVYEGTQGD